MVGDPVGLGVVESLARPGGNASGVSNFAPDLSVKRFQLLLEVVPSARRIAYLTDPRHPAEPHTTQQVRAAAEARGLTMIYTPATTREEIRRAFATALAEKADGLMVDQNSLNFAHRDDIIALAKQHRLPAVYGLETFVRAGGLLSYGTDGRGNARQMASYVDKVLRGTRPADLPVAEPTEFYLTVNLGAATSIGVAIPPAILARADEVIE